MDTNMPPNPRPRAQFGNVERMYDAVVSMGYQADSLNMDQADSVIRIKARSPWKTENQDIWDLWNKGGDPWRQLIKDVKIYSKVVSKHERAKERAAEKAAKAANR